MAETGLDGELGTAYVRAMNRLLHRISVYMLIVGGASLVFFAAGEEPAEAYPSNCSAYMVSGEGRAHCSSGTGSYRVALTCRYAYGTYVATGPWRGPSSDGSIYSAVRCVNKDTPLSVTYQRTT